MIVSILFATHNLKKVAAKQKISFKKNILKKLLLSRRSSDFRKKNSSRASIDFNLYFGITTILSMR